MNPYYFKKLVGDGEMVVEKVVVFIEGREEKTMSFSERSIFTEARGMGASTPVLAV